MNLALRRNRPRRLATSSARPIAALCRRRPGPHAQDGQRISPDVNDPGAAMWTSKPCARLITSRSEALVEGAVRPVAGRDNFDTLNAKAALFAIDEYSLCQTGQRLPLIISGTVTDASGRILSGQTVTVFWYSVRHAQPLAIGLNCGKLGAALMRPYIQELNRVALDTFISCYPNAGLPNPMAETGFDETPDVTSRLLPEQKAWGIVGGFAAAPHARPHRGLSARPQTVAHRTLQRVFLSAKRPLRSGDAGAPGGRAARRIMSMNRRAPRPSGRSWTTPRPPHSSSALVRLSNGSSRSALWPGTPAPKLRRGSQPQPSPALIRFGAAFGRVGRARTWRQTPPAVGDGAVVAGHHRCLRVDQVRLAQASGALRPAARDGWAPSRSHQRLLPT